jgi:UDP-galactopyranose mutase
MQDTQRVVVIGAGPAGIGVGLALGDRAVVVEQAAEPGGLCRTLVRQGAVCDYGGHSFHTPHPVIRDLVFSAVEMVEQRREARCATHGTMIPYPFQAHFAEIGQSAVVEECRDGLADATDGSGAADFEEYLQRRFGPGIAKHFLLPYNRKLWGGDLRRVAADWAAERVAASAGTAERLTETGGRRRPLQADTMVAYPTRGGFGQIMSALARRLVDLRLGRTAVRVSCEDRTLRLHDGTTLRWDRLVSTIPLDRLLALLPDVPAEQRAAAARLQALPLALVLVIVGHPVDTPIQRVYSAEPQYPAHKTALNHNSSADLRALPQHAIVAEVSSWPEKTISGQDLEQTVVYHLVRLGLISSPAVVRATEVVPVPYGYPVPTHGRDTIVGQLKAWLAERGIHTVGRFGEWAYINADEALHRGLALGRMLARG